MRARNKRSIRNVRDYQREAERDPDIASAYRNTVQVWMLRILGQLDGRRRIGEFLSIEAEEVAAAIELELEPDEKAEEAINGFRLAQRLRELEGKEQPERCALTCNLDLLQDALSLEGPDRAVLEFLLMMRKQPDLVRVAELLGAGFTLGDAVEALSVILNIPAEKVKGVVGRGGKLRTSGLIQVERATSDLPNKILVLAQLMDSVSMRHKTAMSILSTFVDASPKPRLTRRDFEDYRADYGLISDHLRGALDDQRTGCNILIYGQPGVGKTQLVRTLAKDLKVNLFEVAAGDNDGEPLTTTSRLGALQLTQRFLGKSRNNAILFDEIEDIFPNTALSWPSASSQAS